jgi:hypothetical protein
MTDTVTFQNIDLSSWDTLYIYKTNLGREGPQGCEMSRLPHFLVFITGFRAGEGPHMERKTFTSSDKLLIIHTNANK